MWWRTRSGRGRRSGAGGPASRHGVAGAEGGQASGLCRSVSELCTPSLCPITGYGVVRARASAHQGVKSMYVLAHGAGGPDRRVDDTTVQKKRKR